MGKETTIIYYTDGSIEEKLGKLVRDRILGSGLPIISVSQEPIDFGKNICVGKVGRHYKNIQTQVLIGATCAETKYIALAEHDTLYPKGYFDWIPPRNDTFYYNKNRVFVVAKKGPQYGLYLTDKDEHPNADQLICNRELFIEATLKRVELLNSDASLPTGWGEPGFNWEGEKFEWRETNIPSIDIFHNNNFTVRFGNFKDIAWEIEGWGRFEEIQ